MGSFYSERGSETLPLEGAIAVIASVSLGNVPQLAIDIMLANTPFKRIGYIGDGSTTQPFVGAAEPSSPDGQSSSGISTGGLEVYGSSSHKLVVIQQRSPTIKTKKEEHAKLVADFVVSNRISFVLVLSSMDVANQDDMQLQTPIQSILPPGTSSVSDEHRSPASTVLAQLRALPSLSLAVQSPSEFASRTPVASSATPAYPPFIPGGGSTRRLLTALRDAGVPHGTIAAWCAEGDNREDAVALAQHAFVAAGLGAEAKGTQLREPQSWRGLFGATNGWSGGAGLDAELYG